MTDERNEQRNVTEDLKRMFLAALRRAGKDATVDKDGCIVIRHTRTEKQKEDNNVRL